MSVVLIKFKSIPISPRTFTKVEQPKKLTDFIFVKVSN